MCVDGDDIILHVHPFVSPQIQISQDATNYLVLLVDIMEIVEMDMALGYRMCHLPPSIENVPPCAIMCKIVKVYLLGWSVLHCAPSSGLRWIFLLLSSARSARMHWHH